ncbi:hypothetical protein KR054_012307, partial [Drosophila jambulina]
IYRAICRVCMARERVMQNIFETPPGSSTSIADMISQCTGIYISQRQAYPETICRSCVLSAQTAFEFKRTFERSHQFFSQIKEEVWILPGDEAGSSHVKEERFEICFLEEEKPEEISFTDHGKNEPTEEDHLIEDEFHISEISEENPSEGRDFTTSSEAERPFKCSHCHKTFIRKHQLASHIRIHTGERPFQCEHCPKSFTQKHILKIHLHTHTGERPYKCTYCPKSFAQKSTQQAHSRLHTG